MYRLSFLLISLLLTILPAQALPFAPKPASFDPSKFCMPALQYAPFTRWWWPGNDIDSTELRRELRLFADHNLGGVEIQPMAMVFPTVGKGRADRIMSYDTPSYYQNLTAALREAQALGMTVDMTNGSGWPTGGEHITEAENNKTLEYGVTDIPTSSVVLTKVPRPKTGDRPMAKLVALLAVKPQQNQTDTATLRLDLKTVKDITSTVSDSTFAYAAGKPGWKAIAVWMVPDMERPLIIARRDAGFAVDHFDSTVVAKNYEHYFGGRTGLEPYFGKPLRAVFNDSYEFRADRHFSRDFLATFKANRGYDATTILPANLWDGYNNMYYRMKNIGHQPSFSFGSDDWRMRYDYDLTVSDLLRKHFISGSRNWLEQRGLLHRTQAYGLYMDLMGAAGDASIPEAETMLFGKACEAGYKIVSSGAHLYNRPIVSSESGVYIQRAFMTTPWKLRLTVDKLLISGINQIIWHGTPYRYFPDRYPKEGWYPFFNSAVSVNFSSCLNEENPYWEQFSDVNAYTRRAQYAMQSGKAQADVLIYYPFLHFSDRCYDPRETFCNGYLKDIEPALDTAQVSADYELEPVTRWISSVWPLIHKLNEQGITWDWVNDESLQQLSANADGSLDIRGNRYQALIIKDAPFIQLASARHLKEVAAAGGRMLLLGNLPMRQPSFLNHKKNDAATAKLMKAVAKGRGASNLAYASEMDRWAEALTIPVRYSAAYPQMRQTRRVQENGDIVEMFWNESDQYATVSIKADTTYHYAYWMDAEKGSFSIANRESEGQLTATFKPFGTRFLYLTTKPLNNVSTTVEDNFTPADGTNEATLNHWTLKVDSLVLSDFALNDWRNVDALKYCGAKGEYTTTVNLNNYTPGKRYYLDLGKVYHTAAITVNDHEIGELLYPPFVTDISGWLHEGENTITVTVTPTKYNEFVGRGVHGDRLFKMYRKAELMAEGLVGPVRILSHDILGQLTAKEKVQLLSGIGMGAVTVNGTVVGSVNAGCVVGAAGATVAIPRLGIPQVVMADGPAGVRISPIRNGTDHTYYATAFPTGTCIASTWDTAAAQAIGYAIGEEARSYGIDVMLSPGINIQRNPLCGRNFEYYSEDPVVAGKMGAAYIRGIQQTGTGTSLKHFAVNSQETHRSGVDAQVSMRALRELYLRSFEIAIKEGRPWSVMSSYNKINGTMASESKPLLTDILRGDWHYDGLVMTDWYGGKKPVEQVRAGNDLLMPGRKNEPKKINEALASGKLSMSDVDRNAGRVLRGVFASRAAQGTSHDDAPDLEGHAAIARRIAADGMVLLKNNHALPLKPSAIALLGNASYDTFIGGSGSGEVNSIGKVSIADGLQQAGFTFGTSLAAGYRNYIETEKAKQPKRTNLLQKFVSVDERPAADLALDELAKASTAAVITIGRSAGEGNDRSLTKDYMLNAAELDLIRSAAKAFHAQDKKVVVLLDIDAPIDIASWRDYADAILVTWLPGQEAGNAVADVVSGKVNPSAKLTVTLPMQYDDVSSAKTFPREGKDDSMVARYDDDIYVGYRYADKQRLTPAYPFGYGLSYTTFALRLTQGARLQGDSITAACTVTNTGQTAGREVVQLYVAAPRGTLDKPVKELRAFTKTRLLKPGESQLVAFRLSMRDLASFSTEASAWIAEGGKYTLLIGTSSRDLPLKATVTLPKTVTVEKVINTKL